MSQEEKKGQQPEKKVPEITRKDHRDIQRNINENFNKLEKGENRRPTMVNPIPPPPTKKSED